jgi:hypothetical protein
LFAADILAVEVAILFFGRDRRHDLGEAELVLPRIRIPQLVGVVTSRAATNAVDGHVRLQGTIRKAQSVTFDRSAQAAPAAKPGSTQDAPSVSIRRVMMVAARNQSSTETVDSLIDPIRIAIADSGAAILFCATNYAFNLVTAAHGPLEGPSRVRVIDSGAPPADGRGAGLN